MDLVKDLEARGLVERASAELPAVFGTRRTIYVGVDPTADSLHVGHLLWLTLMRRFGQAGHKLIFIVGGGTGMIGDPKEKGERVLLDRATIKKNTKAIQVQLKQALGKTPFRMVDNADWLLKIKFVEFLRDIGKHFTVNDLIKRENIKRRLETPDESISYTEFTYSLLQGYDFLMLNRKYSCDVQIGGSDQWTNILSGVDLIRKLDGKEAFAYTFPLVTDSNGKKFGKSEGNAVWLDAIKTSPYAFYQFWLNQPDDSVEKYLKTFTFMPVIEIEALCELHRRNPGRREAQRMLAHLVTEIVHGTQAAKNCAAVSEVLFGDKSLSSLSATERIMILSEAPSSKVMPGTTVVDALIGTGLALSKSEARRLIEGKGVSVGGTTVESPDAVLAAEQFEGGLALLRRGKQLAILALPTSK